jgi:hypothetical protein
MPSYQGIIQNGRVKPHLRKADGIDEIARLQAFRCILLNPDTPGAAFVRTASWALLLSQTS